jgi:hypothetical protein
MSRALKENRCTLYLSPDLRKLLATHIQISEVDESMSSLIRRLLVHWRDNTRLGQEAKAAMEAGEHK